MTFEQLQSALRQAQQQCRARQFAEAENLYLQILAQHPDQAEALHWLAYAHFNLGKFAEAEQVTRREIALEPARADHYCNLSAVLTSLKKYEEAIAAARTAISLRPEFGKAYDILARALHFAGRPDQAIAAYRKGIAAAPTYMSSYIHLAETLFDQRQILEAMAACRQALVAQPSFAPAHFKLGYYHKCLWEMDDAIAECEKAIALVPDYADALMNLATAQVFVGRTAEGCQSYRHSMRRDPSNPYAHSNLILALAYRDDVAPEEISRELRSWNDRYAAPLAAAIQPCDNEASPDRRLRIGYISPDLTSHPVGRFLAPLLANHDHGQFEIYCYDCTQTTDRLSERLRALPDVRRDARTLNHAELAEQVRNDRIDILVDLSLHTEAHRLLVFARKPAPVQVTYLGYCGSTGLTTIDYRLTDPHFDPPGCDETGYTETSVRLPKTYWCYEPLGQIPSVRQLPAPKANFVTFGCLNAYAKVSPSTWKVWTRVLNAVPNSRLMVFTGFGSHRQTARDNLQANGVDPDRLTFVGKEFLELYFARYHEIDIALDPFPFNGGTTTCDALWMGVPVITLRGKTALARAGVSILSNVGLPELIAETPDQYVQIAADLAGDLPRLADLRQSLRQRMQASPLMDAPGFARDVEAAYRQMWHNWCKKRL